MESQDLAVAGGSLTLPIFPKNGFLPQEDPDRVLTTRPELAFLDEIGRDLPSLLQDPGFRARVRELDIPPWPEPHGPEEGAREETLPQLRLYYLRLGFLASAYVNQVSEPPAGLL